jgi:tetratricopeptide (TPR) repeat protein
MGDDCRYSIICSNLGASYLIGGEIEKAVAHGEESLMVGKQAPTQPALLRTWSNLAFAYILSGRLERAKDCFQSWQRWNQDGRSWAINSEFYCESAAVELAFGNIAEALKLISQAEEGFHGRGSLFVNQGALERLRVFRTFYTKGAEVAHQLAKGFVERFRDRHLLAYLEAIAAQAWVERKISGKASEATEIEVQAFERLGATGKRAILVAQGFLDDSV